MGDGCKTNPNYKQPNEKAEGAAKRRLLEWVWEPEEGVQQTRKPKFGPQHYQLHLNEADRAYHQIQSLNGTGGGGNGTAGGDESMADCMKKAVGEACDNIASCDDPVPSNYYDDKDIESLVGMCTIQANAGGMFGCFAQDSEVVVENQGKVSLDSIKVGDKVLAASADGSLDFSRV